MASSGTREFEKTSEKVGTVESDFSSPSSKKDEAEYDKIKQRKSAFFNTSSIRWRITVIMFAGIATFSLFTAILLSFSSKQALILEELEQRRYPVQSQVERSLYTLRSIQSVLQNAIETGSVGQLEEARLLDQEFRQVLDIILNIDPAKESAIAEIEEVYDFYFNQSFFIAEGIVDGRIVIGPDDPPPLVPAFYNNTIKLVESFREREFIEFTRDVSEVSGDADAIVSFGVPIAIVVTIVFLFLTYTNIQSTLSRIDIMGRTLKGIAEYNGDMSVRIQVVGTDEMSELAYWFNRFMARLQRMTLSATAEIRQLAYTDTLTALPNRRAFNERLKSEVERNSTTQEIIGVMFIDLDNFKAINDQLGHDAGDELVRIIAKRLTKTLRVDDAMANNRDLTQSSVARMGGDEFMLILPHLKNPMDAEIVAKRILTVVFEPVELQGKTIEVGGSIGIAVSVADESTAEELVVKADMAMYQAKKGGKNNYCFFNADLEKTAKYTSFVESSLWALVKREGQSEFSFSFQPKFDLTNDTVVGAEALIRWNSREYGHVPPSDFIVIAEKTHLILELDAWVISALCQQIKTWRDAGVQSVPIALNISAKMAASERLVGIVEKSLKDNDVPPSMIEIEITETSALLNIQMVAKNIRLLRKMGVRVSIDDFGAGHASLLLLKHCEIDALKIDRSFVSDVESTESAIFKGIIALAKTLNINTIAEGVETLEHLTMLKEVNCNVAQGYYLKRPLVKQDYEAFLQSL